MEPENENEAEKNPVFTDFDGQGSISFATWHKTESDQQEAEIEAEIERRVRSRIGEVVNKIFSFICDEGLGVTSPKNKDRQAVVTAGFRAFIIKWLIDPSLKASLSQTQLANMLNREHKQSVGREMAKVRDAFQILGEHGLQSEAARAVCRRREKRKKEKKEQEHGNQP